MTKRFFSSPEKIFFTWPLSKKLLFLILDDQVSDVFVCELIWERLFYIKEKSIKDWIYSEFTPSYWSEKYTKAPQIIAERPATIHLTRSIPKEHKQDTVIKAKLNDAQQRKFSRNLIKNVKENSQLSPEIRRQKAEESSRKFIKELN